MFKKGLFLFLTACLLICSFSLASASGLFSELNKTEYADERLPVLDEVADAVYQLKKSGKVRQFGLSHFDGEQMELLQASCKETFLINRISCGVASGEKIDEALKLVNKCGLYGITVQATDTLPTEKVSQDTMTVIKRLSEEYKVSEKAIAIAWSLRLPGMLQVAADITNFDDISAVCEGANINITRKEWYEIFFTITHKHDKVL